MRNAHRSLRVAFIHVSKCICIIKIGLNAHFHGCAGPLHCWSPMTVPKAFFCAKNRFWREIESGRDAGESYRRRSCQEEGEEEREKERERKRGRRIKGEKFLHPCRDLVLVHADHIGFWANLPPEARSCSNPGDNPAQENSTDAHGCLPQPTDAFFGCFTHTILSPMNIYLSACSRK